MAVSVNNIVLSFFLYSLPLFVCYTLLVAIRNIYFHPLSKIPGPLLAKITNAYSAYYSWNGTMHLDVQRLHRKYGDLIRYGPNRILSLYPQDMNGIYGHGKPFRKSIGYETMIPIPDGWSTMTSINKDLHTNLRRIFRQGVTNDQLATYESAILRQLHVYFSQVIVDQDSNGWSAAADMRKWNLYLGFDTMADFGLGLRTDLLRDPARNYVFPTLHVHEKKMGLWEQMPVLNDIGIGTIVAKVMLRFSSQATLFANWYQDFVEQAISNNQTTSRGIFSPIIQSGTGNHPKPGHNYAQMIGEGAFSTFSSADAYGMMFSGMMYYLSHHTNVYERLAGEIRAKYAPGDPIIWSPELEGSLYLRAVIDEVMRMLPPACGVHWRECEAPGVTVGQRQFPMPVGSDVGMSIFTLFRDPTIFRDPYEFWPERWLSGTLPKEELTFARRMFTPFLIGPRSCAGGHVAIMIASIAYAHLLVNYDFRLGRTQLKTSPQVWSNGDGFKGADKELQFESHYSVAGWERGPFVEFRPRTLE